MIRSLDRSGTWRTYSTADGLPGVRIEDIAEDGEGYLWFATWENGVGRFDGDEFENFAEHDGLAHHRVYSIVNDSRNRVWFGTFAGACWFDGAKFHSLEGDGITGRIVQSIFEDSQGNIWCGGQHTLGYYDGAVFHDVTPHLQRSGVPHCWGITQDVKGHLWIGAEFPMRFDGVSFHTYTEDDGFSRAHRSYLVSKDHAGAVWIGRQGDGDRVWRYADGAFEPVALDLGGWLRRIQCDREDRMWFATLTEVWYRDSGGFRSFGPADGLPHPAVKAVVQDRDHQLWFGTWGGVGVYDESIGVFDLQLEFSKTRSEISQIVQDRQGTIWVGCMSPVFSELEKSVFRFKNGGFTPLGAEDGFDLNNCFAIHEDNDAALWFGGINGLFRYDGSKVEKPEGLDGLGDRSICAITRDSTGRLIVGHWANKKKPESGDLYVLHRCPLTLECDRGGRFHTVYEEEKRNDHFSRIARVVAGPDGEVYFCLTEKNSSKSGRGFARWHPDDGLRFYGLEHGLADDNVNDLLLDRVGNLWCATRKGLCRFDGKAFRTITAGDGLPGNYIRCLFEDRKGHLWIGTNSGVARFDGVHFQTIKSPHIGPVCRILEGRDGTFWFGTLLGTVVHYRERRNPPRVRLVRVITDQVYESLEGGIQTTSDRPVIFEYKGLGFTTRPRDMLYTCRLKGYETDWRPATREMRAHYRDLPRGTYTFQVRAKDRDLNLSEAAEAHVSIASDPRIEAFTAIINRRGSQKFIGHSPALRQFQNSLRKVAATDLTVLIRGETGTGKGLAARVLHALSLRCDEPFVEVNCGALPVTLIDSELFGHEMGAFTSAVSQRLGRVEVAEGGTLFLDEIGDMAVETQVKLLRLLEEGTFERVGSNESLTTRTRIVAATNRNLEEMVGTGGLRRDLYYRLNAFPLYLPPLRERKEDIQALAEFFKNRIAAHLDKAVDPLSSEVVDALRSCNWPGNVRELEHAIQRAVVMCSDSQIAVRDLGLSDFRMADTAPRPDARPIPEFHDHEFLPLDELERRHILSVLEAAGWRIKGSGGAAAMLDLPPSTLYGKMRKLGIPIGAR